jgi:hypothetical protein
MKEARLYDQQSEKKQEVAVTISNKYRQPTIKEEKTATDWSPPY